MKRFLLVLASALALCACARQVPGQVKVTGGTIQGTALEDMTVYKGIPFAAPPVGDLRWKAPQPVVAWDGVLECKDFAPNPMQGNGQGCSEDCLYLNVWTPAKSPKEKLPVMVWIYGGGFAGGATSYYDGAELARRGVILVSVAYRVGKLGFLSLPELSAEDPHHVSGNYGLLDQIAGLQWVRDNIARFGGDPAKVTIFGPSAPRTPSPIPARTCRPSPWPRRPMRPGRKGLSARTTPWSSSAQRTPRPSWAASGAPAAGR